MAEVEQGETIQFDPGPDSPWAVDPQTISGTWHFTETPWFPCSITLPPDCTITLHADGKWEGSIEQLRERLANTKSVGADAQIRVLLWLVLREMERDQRFW